MSLFDSLKKMVGLESAAEAAASPSVGSSPANAAPDPEPIYVPEIYPAELHAALEAGEDITLLDVRQSWDHQRQRPAGAQSLPLQELPSRLGELDPARRYVLSCYHGHSSLDGAAFLIENGFAHVQSLRGGFSGWAMAGLPVEPGDSRA